MLDEQVKLLKRLEQQPDAMTTQKLQEACRNMKETTSELKRIAEEKPTSECFSQKLREALSDENKRILDSQCDSLGRAEGNRGTAPGGKPPEQRKPACRRLARRSQSASRNYSPSCNRTTLFNRAANGLWTAGSSILKVCCSPARTAAACPPKTGKNCSKRRSRTSKRASRISTLTPNQARKHTGCFANSIRQALQ